MDDAFGFFLFLMFLGVLVAGYFSALPGDSRALDALSASGYSQSEITGSSAITMRCSRSDSMVFDFTGNNPAGDPVSGFVCCGIFKGCTVRH